MRTNAFRNRGRRRAESGQAMLFVLLGLGIFLIGAMAFAIDLSNLWFNRQSAQTAADAACTAGAMDLLWDATNNITNKGGETAGTGFDCSAHPAYSPCAYAGLNGFSSTNAQGSTALGNNVSVDYPASVPGVTTPPVSVAPTAFMRVTVTDNLPTFFAGMLQGATGQSVRAISVCGITQAAAPIPIIVLDKTSPSTTPAQAALNIAGSGLIQIFGGPSQSIQVNSTAIAATCGASNCSVNLPWGSARIDLHQAGPNGNGADMGLTGFPSAPPSGFIPGPEGHWLPKHSAIPDPFELKCFPGQNTTTCSSPVAWGSKSYDRPAVPAAADGQAIITASTDITSPPLPAACISFLPVGSPAKGIQSGDCKVPYKFHGCPESDGCTFYVPGPYPQGIQVQGETAIFEPGLYYLSAGTTAAGLELKSNSVVRPGTGTGDGSGGITFYFVAGSTNATVTVAADSGQRPVSITVDPFNTLKGPVDSTGTAYAPPAGGSAYPLGAKCDTNSVIPPNLANGTAGVNIDGNILLGPCVGYYGDPLGTTEPTAAATPPGAGEQRGFLFFQDRSATAVKPNWRGSGQFLLAGTMYFHSCKTDGSGTQCSAPTTWYSDVFKLGGTSGSTTYVLGQVIADNLTLQGTANMAMDLNPTTAFNILKAALYQ